MATTAAAPTRTVIQYARHGDSSVLERITDAPVPPRGKGQVLVANRAVAVNPVDYKMRQGFGGVLASVVGPKLPAIPGGDIAGEVQEADEGSRFKPGDRVMGLMAMSNGGYASKVVLPEAALARIPDNLSFEEAAALPLASLTAWQALDLAQVKAGDRVLVHAGAGGVGTYAIQLAKARGCHVTTTCSTRNLDFVKELGAVDVCDYTQDRFEEKYRSTPFDAVLDAIVLHGYEQRSLQVLKKSGTYVHFMPQITLGMIIKGFLKGALGLGPRYRVVVVSPNGAQLAQIARLAEEGKLKAIIARKMLMADAGEAHDEIARGHTRGKIVLMP